MKLQLSLTEHEALTSILGALSEQAHYDIKLENLIQRWHEFVKQVEGGYNDLIYEYINDLSVRDIIARIEEHVPESLRKRIADIVDGDDTRFNNATIRGERSIIHQTDRTLSERWYRIPKLLSGELEADLRSENLID